MIVTIFDDDFRFISTKVVRIIGWKVQSKYWPTATIPKQFNFRIPIAAYATRCIPIRWFIEICAHFRCLYQIAVMTFINIEETFENVHILRSITFVTMSQTIYMISVYIIGGFWIGSTAIIVVRTMRIISRMWIDDFKKIVGASEIWKSNQMSNSVGVNTNEINKMVSRLSTYCGSFSSTNSSNSMAM